MTTVVARASVTALAMPWAASGSTRVAGLAGTSDAAACAAARTKRRSWAATPASTVALGGTTASG